MALRGMASRLTGAPGDLGSMLLTAAAPRLPGRLGGAPCRSSRRMASALLMSLKEIRASKL